MKGRVNARRSVLAALAVVLVVILLPGAAAQGSPSAHPLQTGFMDNRLFESADAPLGFQRAAQAGATIDRTRLNWNFVAPTQPTNPTNPGDPAYKWSTPDTELEAAAAAGQTVMLNIFAANAPTWATNVPGWPASFGDPQAIADFALAAATRYDGTHRDAAGNPLPRVKYWEIWDEPNLGLYVEPQFQNGQPIAAIWYRTVLDLVSTALKSVHADNFVIAGSTSPYYDQTASTTAVNAAWGPLGFMRAVLCLTPQLTVNAAETGCPTPVKLDAWAHHPYTEGGPTHMASLADDVELGDMPRMKATLDAAWNLGLISASSAPELWATEFSWNSNPPDSGGVPMTLLERWISEAMYDLWRDGVSVLMWYQLVDGPAPEQSGFYTDTAALAANQPKASLEAFRLPFVAYQSAGGVRFWGRTPGGVAALPVDVEQSDGNGGWTQLGQVTSDQYGIFQGRFSTSSLLPVRARIDAGASADANEAGVPFSLRLVPDRFYPSWGRYQLEPSRTYAPRPAIQSPGAYGARPPIPAWTP